MNNNMKVLRIIDLIGADSLSCLSPGGKTSVALPQKDAYLFIDSVKVEQVIRNLITNAVRSAELSKFKVADCLTQ